MGIGRREEKNRWWRGDDKYQDNAAQSQASCIVRQSPKAAGYSFLMQREEEHKPDELWMVYIVMSIRAAEHNMDSAAFS